MPDDDCRCMSIGVTRETVPGCPMHAPAAPDRPGDRDQQQAADRATAQRVLDTAPLLDLGGAIAAALADARREGEIHAWEVAQGHVAEAEKATRFLVAAARAEEAARWQAKIEALAVEFVSEAQKAAASTDPELANPYINAAARLRAVLDAS